MSTLSENEFDLEKLFLPAWAQEPSAAKYVHYEGGDDRPERRGPRPPRRDGGFGPRRDDSRPRQGGPRPGPGRPDGARDRSRPGDRSSFNLNRDEARPHREPPPPLPEIDLSLLPEERGVESLARQIKVTGRAYPLFDIAQMILQKPERYSVIFATKKNPQGQPIQPLLFCALDDTLWLSEKDAIAHVLKKHFAVFYQAERTPIEPPKGKYTFVAQCGLSGVILGPPNHHDYQNQLRKLHADRFSRMPFEAFKARVRIVRDEEVVKKWVDDQSWRTEFNCLNLPEPLRLANMEAVEKHFAEVHKENIIKPIDSYTLSGVAARALRCSELTRLVRNVWEDQRRFPLQIATVLSQQFASHGLQFFKVNKAVTHVCIARPHYLDLDAAPVSEGIKRIVQHLGAHPKCTRRDLIESLAPSAPAPSAPAQPLPVEGLPPSPPKSPEPSPEQTLVIADLHWLVHQGHVIEFANGLLETAKKPLPKPPKLEIKAAPKTAAPASSALPAAQAEAPAIEPAASDLPASASATAAPEAPALQSEPDPAGAHPSEEPPPAPGDASVQNLSAAVETPVSPAYPPPLENPVAEAAPGTLEQTSLESPPDRRG